MALINCKNCGGSIDLSEDKTFGTCDFCGSTMTFPKLDDDQRAAAFNRGNHFRRIGEFDKALAVYERIVQENDQDAEAHWCCALCRFGIEYVEDPETFEWLPTCHRASFDSFLEDVDYLAAVEHSEGLTQRQYRKDAAKIAEVQRGILATSQNAEAYDVFICYKESDAEGQRTRDSLMAQDIYYQLTEQGKRVFFARITLEDVAGTQYEPYIFAALNSAKVMVVVGTKPEHFSAVWVKNEWSRFLAMMRKDRSKLLLPCYAGMDPYDLPEQLSVLQSYDMTKIGFIQDLIRGIGKVVDADKKPEAAPVAAAQPVVQPVIQQSNNVTALLKRGAMALEDGDWARADEFYEEVLNQDAECGEAYLGKFLAGQQCSTLEAVARKRIDTPRKAGTESFTVKPDMTGVEEFAQAHRVYGFLTKEQILKGFPSAMNITLTAPGWRKILEEEPTWWTGNKVLARAEKYGTPELRTQVDAAKKAVLDDLHRRLTNAEATDRKTEENARATLAQKTEDGRRVTKMLHQTNRDKWDKRFKDLSEDLDRFDSVSGLTATIRSFELLGPDPAVRDKIAACNKKISALREEERARREAEEKARQDAEAKEKKTIKLIAIITAAVLVVFLLCIKVIIPASNYKKAEALLAEGRYAEAITAFEALNGYKDSVNKIEECIEEQNIDIYGEEAWNKIKNINVGDVFKFGSYEQDNNKSNGQEDIEWLVLEKDGARILVVSKYALDCKPYNTSYVNVTWETCTLRKWLNNDFINAAFSADEKAMIPTVTVPTDKNPDYEDNPVYPTNPGKPTQDQIFLLSFTEVDKYFSSDSARQCKPTDYAVANGAFFDSDPYGHGTCWWWLRVPGKYQSNASYVDILGRFWGTGLQVNASPGTVRPALWIDFGA